VPEEWVLSYERDFQISAWRVTIFVLLPEEWVVKLVTGDWRVGFSAEIICISYFEYLTRLNFGTRNALDTEEYFFGRGSAIFFAWRVSFGFRLEIFKFELPEEWVIRARN